MLINRNTSEAITDLDSYIRTRAYWFVRLYLVKMNATKTTFHEVG